MTRYADMTYTLPNLVQLKKTYEDLNTRLTEAGSAEDVLTIVLQWDQVRRETETAQNLVDLKRSQDFSDKRFKDQKSELDEMEPDLKILDIAFVNTLLAHPQQKAVEAELGRQFFAIWECKMAGFDPAIADELRTEAHIKDDYQELTTNARINFQGEEVNLSGLRKYFHDKDPLVRHAACQAHDQWLGENGEQLDDIFDKLVKLRHSMAQKLGYENFIPMGYKNMTRTEYGPEDVKIFRDAIVEHVVPLATRLRKQQAERLELEQVRFTDEPFLDLAGPPHPKGDADWLADQFRHVFGALGEATGSFWETMLERGLLDLDNRQNKAPGGFCTDFPVYKTPFIYQNSNGTMQDIITLAHEGGHAFQSWTSREAPLLDYMFPTYEACEVHSMSMEYLVWPHLDKVLDPAEADRYRRYHLTNAVTTLPYLCAIDHFQHLVYENPEATPAERLGFWRDMEKRYQPDRVYDDMPALEQGRWWQRQLHVYRMPFYYIDYALAETCALQMWRKAEKDRPKAMTDYVALCEPGGALPFLQMIKRGNLDNPMEKGVLSGLMKDLAEWLEKAWS